jgi:hypothetical protein
MPLSASLCWDMYILIHLFHMIYMLTFQLLVTQLASLIEPCVVFKSFIIQYQGSYICGPQNWKNHETVNMHFLCCYLTMLSVPIIHSIKWQDR